MDSDMLDAELGERIDNGVRDRRQPWRDPALAAAAHAERVCRRRTSLISVSKPGSRSARGSA
jgi:hypothetical protein